MAGGGFCRLPNGTVVVALTLTRPADGSGPYGGTGTAPGAPVRVLVHAANRARALTRLRNLGLRAVYLRGNDRPPTPDEVTAVLHHPDGLLWRGAPPEGPAAGGPGGPGAPGGRRGAVRPGAAAGGPEVVPLVIRCAALTDTGAVRTENQDAAFAGPRLLAVADGFGERGAEASAAAIEALKPSARGVGESGLSAADLLNTLEDTADSVSRAVREAVAPGAAPDGSGTTLTAMLWTGSRLGLVHIGDSRAYLLRGGGLYRITHDHSLVQAMIDDGSLSPEEAASHPERALLLKALVGAGRSAPTAVAARPDIRLREVRAGDRYLLCSDGLSAVVDEAGLREAVIAAETPEDAVRRLVGLAHEAGGPDNVACVVADVVTDVVVADAAAGHVSAEDVAAEA
ncbi:PP2C family protein-serine/threonine phosphatase [Streptomyces californicus]|uniref:PP2C family protein-serine/threonine phosphatase n=1 Tax=Streptomyces californicus TaxID=67351 RepID=UPI0036A5EF32